MVSVGTVEVRRAADFWQCQYYGWARRSMCIGARARSSRLRASEPISCVKATRVAPSLAEACASLRSVGPHWRMPGQLRVFLVGVDHCVRKTVPKAEGEVDQVRGLG